MEENATAFNEYVYQSTNINDLADALSKAQGSWAAPRKDKTASFPTKTGQRISYDYADLTTIIENAKPYLKENGLSISQKTIFKNNLFVLETVLMHSSGQWTKSHYPLPSPINMKPQDFGSHLTYARRYSFCAITNISADADDDANIAQGNNANIISKVTNKMTQRPAEIAQNKVNQAAKLSIPKNTSSNNAMSMTGYVFKKGKFLGKNVQNVDINELKQWVDYMNSKGFINGQDYNEAVNYITHGDK